MPHAPASTAGMIDDTHNYRPAVNARPRTFWGVALAILLVGFAVRVWNLGGPSLWTDEVSTEYRAQASLDDSLESILDAGNQTPLYYLILRLLPTSSEFLLRLPSALFGLLSVALLMFLVVELYGQYDLALWAGALLAVNPYHVWLSRTARFYALVSLLSIAVAYFFLKLVRGQRSRGIWIGFTLSSMAAYFTQLTTLALPGAQYVLFGFFVRKEPGFFRRWMAAQAVAVIPSVAWMALLTTRPPEVKSEWVPHPGLKDLPLTLWNMTAGYDGALHWYTVPALIVAGVGLWWGIVTAIRERRTERVNFFWVWLIAVPLLPVWFMSLFISFYVDRYFAVFLPALILLIILGWMTWPRAGRPIWIAALSVLIAANGIGLVATFDSGDYERADWQGVADYITAHYQPGDGILVEREIIEQTFRRYFDDDHPAAATITQLRDTPDTPIDTTAFEQAHPRIWAIYRNPNEDVHRLGTMPAFDPFEPDLALMGDWLLDRRDRAGEPVVFNGVTVILVTGETPAAAPLPPRGGKGSSAFPLPLYGFRGGQGDRNPLGWR